MTRQSNEPVSTTNVVQVDGEMLENFAGRIRNTDLPYSAGLLPLFEAVVNSIHATENIHSRSNYGLVEIIIEREAEQPQGVLLHDQPKSRGPEPLRKIKSFEIRDDGIGFDNQNLLSFRTLDSDYKIEKGCRGIGRLVWLKAFQYVSVSSVYVDSDGKLCRRQFTFDSNLGVSNIQEERLNSEDTKATGSIVRLVNFGTKYRKPAKKTADGIASELLEHILWYFIRNTTRPQIKVIDNGSEIDLDQVFDDFMHEQSASETIDIGEHAFDLTHVKIKPTSGMSHAIAFCADSRLVKVEKIQNKISGLGQDVADSNGEFLYQCYVTSKYLDENARSNRTGFDIEDESPDLFDGTLSTMNEIRAGIFSSAEEFLEKELQTVRSKMKDRVENYVQTTGVRYRPIVRNIDDLNLSVSLNATDKELDLALHKQLAKLESQLLEDGHDLIERPIEAYDAEYQSAMKSYVERASQLKMSDLAGYVSHRHIILDLLGKAIRRLDDGTYAKEEMIHNLIMPMGTDSCESSQASNLWLIDERLAFHDYLASDKSISSNQSTTARSAKEPDLAALKITDNPLLVSETQQPPLASIVIVEIKRPMRKDASAGPSKDPVEQSIDYLKRIRGGDVLTASGRQIPKSPEIPGFCYVIADLTKQLRERCEDHHDLRATQDNLGYFGYKKNVQTYIEVISYDRLYMMAMQRNRAFFDKLGLPRVIS